MSTHKKYDLRIVKNTVAGKDTWTAEITRRVTTKKTTVSKSQDGFATEAEAKSWGEKELVAFLENLTNRNKRDFAQHLKNKKEKVARDDAYKQRKKDAENTDVADADVAGTDTEDADLDEQDSKIYDSFNSGSDSSDSDSSN